MRLLLLAGGLCLAAGLALALPAIGAHEDARAAWRAERTELGSPAYSAEQSDALYEQADRARRRSQAAGTLLGAALWMLIAGWRPYEPEGRPVRRIARATLVDGLMSWLLLAFSLITVEHLDPMNSAWAACLKGMTPFFAFLPYAALVWGASVGLRAISGSFRAEVSRRLVAAAAGPLSLPVLILGLPFRTRFPWVEAIHLGLPKNQPEESLREEKSPP